MVDHAASPPTSTVLKSIKTSLDFWFQKQKLTAPSWEQIRAGPWQNDSIPGWFSLDWRFSAPPQHRFPLSRIFWSARLPSRDQRFAGVVSSSLGHQFVNQPLWIAALRTAVCQLARDRFQIVTAEGTATHEFVHRLATLMQVSQCVLKEFPTGQFRPLPNVSLEQEKRLCQEVFYASLPSSDSTFDANTIDHDLIVLADCVRILAINKRRHIFSAVQSRLTNEPAPGSTWLRHSPELTPESIYSEMIHAGAVEWLVQNPDQEDSTTHTENLAVDLMDREAIERDEFLLHCTRSPKIDRRAPSASETIDELLFRQNEAETGPLLTLLRILTSGRLLGSQKLTRGERNVICLTQHSVFDLPQLRVYRKHLARWDFEPFGIAIKRRVAEHWGARPVCYGTADEFERLPSEEIPFFQQAESIISGERIDWRMEREWRMLDDLLLNQIGPTDAFLFVPTIDAAQCLQPFSRWPIHIVGHSP